MLGKSSNFPGPTLLRRGQPEFVALGLKLPFMAFAANGRYGEGFLMRVAAERYSLARLRAALENLPRRKPRVVWAPCRHSPHEAPRSALGREQQERCWRLELRSSVSIAESGRDSEEDRLKRLRLVENRRRSGYSQNVATHQGYTKLYLEMYPT